MSFPRITGICLIVFAVLMNIPFTLLSVMFDYPDILRQPTAEILQRFSALGTPLIFVWWSYMAVAALLIPLALMLHQAMDNGYGDMARVTSVFAVLAGLTQAIGLSRWVFAVPGLAAITADPASSEAAREAATVVFAALHQFAGVAIGEHLGQIFTALWAISLGSVQLHRGLALTGAAGIFAGVTIALGLIEGFSTVIAFDPGLLAVLTPVGFLLLSAWIATTGISLIRGR